MKDLSYLYPVFPIIGSIAVFFCLLPVPLHWGAGNIAIVFLSLWQGIGLLIFVIDSCIWHGNIRNPHPIWGDIAQVYIVMITGGAPSSCMLYIQYQLWNIARLKTVFITKRQKRRQIYAALFFCLGIPMIVATLHSVVQGHRYNLYEDLGPWFTTYNVTLSYPIYLMWDPIFCLVAALFAIHTAILLSTQRKELDIALNSGATRINGNRYMRLFVITIFAACINICFALWPVIYNATALPVYPWISWKVTQSNYSRIQYVTRFYLGTAPGYAMAVSAALWGLVVYNFLIFISFGLGNDAMVQYQSWLRACLKVFGVELLKEERGVREGKEGKEAKEAKEVKRRWLDVLLRRPIRPIFADSFPRNRQRPHSTFDTVHTQPGHHIVESRVDTQDQDHTPGAFKSNIETRVSICVHPDQIERSETGISNTDPVPTTPVVEKPRLSGDGHAETVDDHRVTPKVEGDIEAQAVSTMEIEAERRREILEQNPELTEEVTF